MSAESPLEDAGTSRQPESASAPASHVALRADVVVIGAGQAGLSSAYHLKKRGLEPGRGFVELARRFVVAGTDEPRRETLFLGFRERGGRWVLVDLRIAP